MASNIRCKFLWNYHHHFDITFAGLPQVDFFSSFQLFFKTSPIPYYFIKNYLFSAIFNYTNLTLRNHHDSSYYMKMNQKTVNVLDNGERTSSWKKIALYWFVRENKTDIKFSLIISVYIFFSKQSKINVHIQWLFLLLMQQLSNLLSLLRACRSRCIGLKSYARSSSVARRQWRWKRTNSKVSMCNYVWYDKKATWRNPLHWNRNRKSYENKTTKILAYQQLLCEESMK